MKDRHAVAIARHVVRRIEEQPPRLARRLLFPQLGWLAATPDPAQARKLGVLKLVEQARDDHLAKLEADDGLAALLVQWTDVVREAAALAEPAPPHRCERCGARLPRRRRVCSRCRLAVPR